MKEDHKLPLHCTVPKRQHHNSIPNVTAASRTCQLHQQSALQHYPGETTERYAGDQ